MSIIEPARTAFSPAEASEIRQLLDAIELPRWD